MNQKIKKTNGTCTFCNSSINKTKMKAHLKSCKQKQAIATPLGKQTPTKKAFLILVSGISLHEYWIYFEVPANVKLKRIDSFLRKTWVECCGHLSAFSIKGKMYQSTPDKYFNDLSMNYSLDKLLDQGINFSYEYDFGSPTQLDLKVISEYQIESADSSIKILARNDPPLILCETCGNPATYICAYCEYLDEGWLCDECAVGHECGEEMLLPVVNSPRVGVCGYVG